MDASLRNDQLLMASVQPRARRRALCVEKEALLLLSSDRTRAAFRPQRKRTQTTAGQTQLLQDY
jgi:hypothetical protein